MERIKHLQKWLIIGVVLCCVSCAKEINKERIIEGYGTTYDVVNPNFETITAQDYKVVFDIGRQFEKPDKVNPLFNTAARYLNMHAKAGVPKDNMKVALVVHGSAALDLLNNAEYQKKYKTKNPNLPLLSELNKAGVEIILCGQTAAHRNIKKETIHPDVKIALSAMTALVTLQNLEYRLINF